MEYYVVSKYLLSDLIKGVNQLLKEGWSCQGGIATSTSQGNARFYYYQAMIKE